MQHSIRVQLNEAMQLREKRAKTKFEKNRRARTANKQTEGFVLDTRLSIGERFLGFLGDHPHILPSRYNMQAYFLFLDRAHFLRNFHQWIRAALMLFKFKVSSSHSLSKFI